MKKTITLPARGSWLFLFLLLSLLSVLNSYSQRVIRRSPPQFAGSGGQRPGRPGVTAPQQLLTGAGMNDSTAWQVYNEGSAHPASYQFNYTVDTPAGGKGGCLHITSTQPTDILFWQKKTLLTGHSYTVDGLVKIGNVASFWCELYLSTVAPSPNTDYAPNNNGDVIRGFSTWDGCGPNANGTFSALACEGKEIYTVPGTPGHDTTVYFGLKTGSLASPLPATLDVLVDTLSLVLIQDSILLSTQQGIFDRNRDKIIQVSPFLTVESFKAGLLVAPTATVDVVSLNGGQSIQRQDTTLVSDTMAVLVTGLNGTRLYPIQLRPVSSKAYIVSLSIGSVDHDGRRIQAPGNARVVQLQSSLTVSPHARFRIVNSNGQTAAPLAFLDDRMTIIVTAENGDSAVYRIRTGRERMPMRTLFNSHDTLTAIYDKILILQGNCDLTIQCKVNPLKGSVLDLRSEDCWLYFPAVRADSFVTAYLPQIMINGQTAVPGQNIRAEAYLGGTLLISQSANYSPLQVYTEEHLSGASMPLSIYTYYWPSQLGAMNDAIKSFRLKKGYMATFAKDSIGTGYSRVYVADQQDIVIDSLPVGLYNDVSFVRVIPWKWVSKKGWTNGTPSARTLGCSWHYDWDNSDTSLPGLEYIPMRHDKWWNSFSNINNKRGSTHALGFNEPDRPDQANMSVNDAIALWPQLLQSGLRLGSPAPSDGGLNWLYQFIDRCDALNYRVDFVAMHYYQGGQTAQEFYNELKTIHERTGRPIWITEWNNGANWTCCTPSYPQQAETIAKFMQMLDTTSFVERYALYEWVGPTRQMFYTEPDVLTPAGEVYKSDVAPMAYNPAMAFSHSYVKQPIEYAGTGVGFDYGRALAVDIDNDGDLDIVYSGVDPYVGGILKNDGKGNFTNTGQSIPGLYIPTLDAGDLDGDGNLDLIMSGWDRANGWPAWSRILHNDGTGNFTLQTMPSINAPCAGITDLDNNGRPDYFMIGNGNNNNKFYFQQDSGFQSPVNRMDNSLTYQDPAATWVDVNNDQQLDFCLQAWNGTAGRRYTQIWKGNGDGTYTEQADPFLQKHWGSAQFADIDNDGDLDMLLNGDGDKYSDGGSSEVYRLYINDGHGNFTPGATFQNYRQNCNGKGSAFVDWNNDGNYDIIITGWSSTENKEVANIYLNDGTGVFTKSPESANIPGINQGTIEIGDFDNDGRVDLLLNGYSGTSYARNVAFLYKNTTDHANTKPNAPSNPQTIVKSDSVQFSWSAGSDAESKVKALTYNLYVKDASGKYYIFPNANINTGQRMTVGLGNTFLNTGWQLHGLPAGAYTWGVQTIDAAYAGSSFTAPATFVISDSVVAARNVPRAMITAQTLSPLTTDSAFSGRIVCYPNPMTDHLNIQLGGGDFAGASTTLQLFDGYGRVMQTVVTTEQYYVLSPGNIAPGVYWLEVTQGGKTVMKKIIKR